jgi:NADH dehydrogenase
MQPRVITVFGGSGFIGRHLIRRLVAQRATIRVAVRDTESAHFLQPVGDVGQIVPVPADVTDKASVAAAVRDASLVINLVGILYGRGRRSFQAIHVEGAANVAEAARAAGAQRLVQMSAIGADPDSPAEYGRTKAAGEDAARAAFPGASVTRPSVVFGPEDAFFNRFAAMARISPVLPVFDVRFQPVFVGDVAEAIVRILADPDTRGRTFELGGPRVMHFREVMQLVCRETARDRWLVSAPVRLAHLKARVLELLPVPPLTRDQLRLMERDNVVAAGAAGLRELGIEPTAAEAIVPMYLARYRPPSKQRRRLA